MDLQRSVIVINLPRNCRLTSQHIFNNNLNIAEYPINLTTIATGATFCKDGLQITKVNQNLLDFVKIRGKKWSGILWSWWHREDSWRSSFAFYLTILLPFRNSQFTFFFSSFFIVPHPFLYTTLLHEESSNQLMCHPYLNF